MNQFSPSSVGTVIRKEVDEAVSTLRSLFSGFRDSVQPRPNGTIVQRIGDPPMIDPEKFKKILFTLLKVLIVLEFVGAFLEGVQARQWSRFGFDLLAAGVLYVMWERIKALVREKKDEFKRKIETAPQQIRLWDALAFSLLWSDEIYRDIPADRRRLVVITYTLIALGLGAAYFQLGSGLMPLVLSGMLVLAAVNILAWVVSLERGEKESLQTELKLAHDVQVSLMPKQPPTVEGYDIAGISLPAKEVGGDHFDYTCLGSADTSLGISVFDVSGKGMQAAMSAVFTSGAYASEAQQSTSAGEILTRLNRSVFTHSKRGNFVAFLLAVLDVNERTMAFANAGQLKPLLKTSGGVQWLDSTGVTFPLGMKEDSRYEERVVQLRSGDVLFFLTDGFTEAMNAGRELFGNERLEGIVRELETEQLHAQAMLDCITNKVRSYIGDAPQHDDMTMVVAKVL